MIFCMNIKIKVFQKLIVSFLLVTAGHVQSTQNCKFMISLQYLKKEVRYEVGKKINIKLSYKLMLLILEDMARPAQTSLQNLSNISRKK